jgi:hypothetical protein
MSEEVEPRTTQPKRRRRLFLIRGVSHKWVKKNLSRSNWIPSTSLTLFKHITRKLCYCSMLFMHGLGRPFVFNWVAVLVVNKTVSISSSPISVIDLITGSVAFAYICFAGYILFLTLRYILLRSILVY